MPERKRGYLREQRLKSIKKRRRLIKGQKYSGRYLGEWIDEPEFKSGILAKGHNGLLGRGGTAVKTNTRKGHASYRHKGAYGPADNYSRHDKQQVEDGAQQIKEWENKNEKRNILYLYFISPKLFCPSNNMHHSSNLHIIGIHTIGK